MVIWVLMDWAISADKTVVAFVLCMLDKNNNFQYICNQHHYEKLCHIILINRCGVVDFM